MLSKNYLDLLLQRENLDFFSANLWRISAETDTKFMGMGLASKTDIWD